ncbi:hypothetical protein BD310DRAFT_939669 [Dichomitus squalens]|uniref:Uncharacterized protein n=1 Tax=Dichomitus squalens TaxID=114155 RepID=A0A4Q9PH10_9APHY|nr:hypothetical protein BD310DRAFT_939669 [Dichomitus squalens]
MAWWRLAKPANAVRRHPELSADHLTLPCSGHTPPLTYRQAGSSRSRIELLRSW